jgi:hypothetical protein
LVGSAKRGLRCAIEVIDEENPGGERLGERRSSEGDRGSARGDYRPRTSGGGSGVGTSRRSDENRGTGARDRY